MIKKQEILDNFCNLSEKIFKDYLMNNYNILQLRSIASWARGKSWNGEDWSSYYITIINPFILSDDIYRFIKQNKL